MAQSSFLLLSLYAPPIALKIRVVYDEVNQNISETLLLFNNSVSSKNIIRCGVKKSLVILLEANNSYKERVASRLQRTKILPLEFLICVPISVGDNFDDFSCFLLLSTDFFTNNAKDKVTGI